MPLSYDRYLISYIKTKFTSCLDFKTVQLNKHVLGLFKYWYNCLVKKKSHATN